MKNYLRADPPVKDTDFVSVIDELPLWSAPFGLRLLECIHMRPGINVLDIGCGLGFPLIEIAERLGPSAKVYGIDPWEKALDRVRLKAKMLDLKNVELYHGMAETMPFADRYFDLLVSNNGLNNVANPDQVLKECARVAKPDSQLVFTMNLEDSMMEFYRVFKEVLICNNLLDEIDKLKEHIHHKRMPLPQVKHLLTSAGYGKIKVIRDSFTLRFLNSEALFSHSLIKYWFLGAWKEILKRDDLERIFVELEIELDKTAAVKGELKLTIPFATICCNLK